MNEDLASWLSRAAVPLTGLGPTSGPDDGLAPWLADLDGVSVVGLGEATHGSAEFFGLKHRLLAALITEAGCRTIALEVSTAACRRLDAYVCGLSDDDPAEALTALGYWTWATEEMLRVVVWLRDLNLTRPQAERVRILGIDPVVEPSMIDDLPRAVAALGAQESQTERCRAALGVIAGAQHQAPGFARLVSELALARLPSTAARRDRQAALEQAGEDLRALADQLRGSEQEADAETVQAAVDDLELAARAATIESSLTLSAAGSSARDVAMAQVVIGHLTRSDTADRGLVALWAHNGHVAVQPYGRRRPNLGGELRRWLGSRYYAMGLLFGSGCFQALAAADGGYSAPRAFCYPDVRRDTVEGRLLTAHPTDFVLDLRSALRTGDPVGAPDSVRRWLRRTGRTRSIGSVVAWWWLVRRTSTPLRPARAFDGLGVLARTTRARPITAVPGEREAAGELNRHDDRHDRPQW